MVTTAGDFNGHLINENFSVAACNAPPMRVIVGACPSVDDRCKTAQPVRDYIYDQLVAVAEQFGVDLQKSKSMGEGKDGDFSYMITWQPEALLVLNDNEEEFYAHFNDPANPHR